MQAVTDLREVACFDDEADVVVLGYGIAGSCAALEARRCGGDVLVVERTSGGGGNCSLSSGIFYLGGGTAVQRAAGFDDTPENMYRFLIASMGPERALAIRRYCDHSVAHFEWLEAQGIVFERSYFPDKAVWTPGTEGLIGSGNEHVWPYCEIAHAIPRGHQVAVAGEASGIGAMVPLLARCKEEGVRVLHDGQATALIVDEAGCICGATVRRAGQMLHLRARHGVVLATGGFGMSAEMLARYFPGLPESTVPSGTPQTDGAGIRLAEVAGAVTSGMTGMIPSASIYPPAQLIKGILVNRRGQRFVAEDSYHGRIGAFVAEQPEGRAFLIVDSDIFAYPEIGFHNHRLVDGFDTIEEMEQKLELPGGALAETIARYSRDAAGGVDTLFFKGSNWLKPLDKGPWAAFDISFDRSNYLYITLGGLVTDEEARVLTADGSEIPGLFAAGACTAQFSRDGKSYASGISLGTGSYFGRIAGRNAVRAANPHA
ncbi:MAG: FAD-dependent oxidoreductase [Sphingomonadales bacterium]|nr:FAD-dependent oxidoreductase [Sphingomonadales bacterium]